MSIQEQDELMNQIDKSLEDMEQVLPIIERVMKNPRLQKVLTMYFELFMANPAIVKAEDRYADKIGAAIVKALGERN